MNYQEALEYILRFADYERLPRSGIVWDLRRMDRLLARLGDPQLKPRTVHVAGTKGKGSTAAMMAAILKQAGYRTGLYTSPHLLAFTERIQVDGSPISEGDWARLTEIIQPEVEAVNAAGEFGELTTFEILTAMAFLHFARIGADYQVLEVGLGGRLDATNVVRPQVAVITSISYDHTDVLGDTLAKIAGEKAGIIKPGCVAVSSPQQPEAMAVLEKVCRERGVKLIKTGDAMAWRETGFDAGGQTFTLKSQKQNYDLKIPLLGTHQLENAAAAVAAAEALADLGTKITAEHIAAGLAGVRWPGRLQVLRNQPWIVVDSAHNTDSMRRLGQALKKYFIYDKLTLILGFGGDKDIGGMVAEAAALADDIILVRSRHPRAVSAAELAEKFTQHGIKPKTVENVAAALRTARAAAAPGDLIAAAGSVFVIAEVLEAMSETK